MREPLEISPEAVRKSIEDGRSVRLIDIREAHERDEGEIQGAEPIPMFRLPHALGRLRQPGVALILFCSNGARSLRAAVWLRQNGVAASYSLAGGLEAWNRLDKRGAPPEG
ncbi:MAG: rhodanese-like domain-containing protein [bacterium]